MGLKFESPGEARAYFERHPEEWKGLPKKHQEVFFGQFEQYRKNKEDLPIFHFRPNLPQMKLLTMKNRQGQMPRVLMLEGANKTGKTTFGVCWQISMAVGFYPWLKKLGSWHFEISKKYKVFREILGYCGFDSYDQLAEEFGDIKKLVPALKVPNVNLAVGETFTESVDKDLVPKYLELIPKEWKPKPKKNQQGVIAKITLEAGPGKGSVFYFRSFKSTPDEFEGIDTSGSILFNEPPPESIVTAVLRGAMPFDTRVMFSYTALKEPWIYRNYVNKAKNWLI